MKSRLYRAVILIAMMFGHNYVLNQAQSMQKQIQQIHNLSVPEFNLLYSIPSAVSIFFIIPLGILYDNHAQKILLFGAFALLFGQILVTIFGPNFISHSFLGFLIGRVFQGNGAQVLYMIQGNLASTWMGKTAGMIFILPQIGEILNVLITPFVTLNYGILQALLFGLIACIISFIACILLYRYMKKSDGSIQLMNSSPNQILNQKQAKTLQITNEQQIQSYQPTQTQVKDKLQKVLSSSNLQKKRDINIDSIKTKNIQKKNILKAGKVFWLTLIVCSINQCLYFPFLDNANVLIQNRFCVPPQKTGIYLCLPFISAMLTTFLSGKYFLYKYKRQVLIFFASLIPFLGHFLIYMNRNCDFQITLFEQIFLILGLMLFGAGLGSYYSISFPAVGLAVPWSIRGTAYACLCFCQTISMTIVPQISGIIIQEDEDNNDNFIEGYKNSSFFFVCLCALGVLFSFIVYLTASEGSFSHDDYENQKTAEEKIIQKSHIEMSEQSQY